MKDWQQQKPANYYCLLSDLKRRARFLCGSYDSICFVNCSLLAFCILHAQSLYMITFFSGSTLYPNVINEVFAVLHIWNVVSVFVAFFRVHRWSLTDRNAASDSDEMNKVFYGGVLGLLLLLRAGCCLIKKTWMCLCPWMLYFLSLALFLPPTLSFPPLAARSVRSRWRSVCVRSAARGW